MTVLAIDLGSRTGWAVATPSDDGLGRVIASGVIAVRGQRRSGSTISADAARAHRLACVVGDIVLEHGITVLAVEQIYGRYGSASRSLLTLRGAALAGALTARPELRVIEAPIRAWQAWAACQLGWSKGGGRDGDRRDAEAIARWIASGMPRAPRARRRRQAA